ncbi:MAG: DnaA/Hda family protein [Planctomycetia bacterium]|nr:DnaA/Hda family protein [Planctomycetia bacterium]
MKHALGQPYTTWVEEKVFLEWNVREKVLVVTADNAFVANWNREKYSAQWHRVAKEVLGDGLEVRIESVTEGTTRKKSVAKSTEKSTEKSAGKSTEKKGASPKPVSGKRTARSRKAPDVAKPRAEKLPAEKPQAGLDAFLERMGTLKQSSSRRRPVSRAAEVVRNVAAVSPQFRYGTFDTFVEGMSNTMACTTARQILSQPGMISPIVFYGDTGVGKTHLLDAVWSSAKDAGWNIQYSTAEEFTTDFFEMVRDAGKRNEFRRRYRQADLLILDDLQFLFNKTKTAAELLHVMKDLQRSGRQVLLACDRPLDQMAALGKELYSFLKAGFWCRVEVPDFDVRTEIIARLSQARGIKLTAENREYIASRFTGDVRGIVGAMNTLCLMSRTYGGLSGTSRASVQSLNTVDAGLVEKVLLNMTSDRRPVRVEEIKEVVCEMFGIEPDVMVSGGRARKISQPRMLAMWLARKYTRKPLAEIGKSFGCSSHSTVISAQKKVDSWLKADTSLATSREDMRATEILRQLESKLHAA